MLTADLEIFMWSTSYNENLNHYIENDLYEVKDNSELGEFLQELAEQICCNVYANDTYEDDLAKSYCDYLFYDSEFEQNIKFVSGININDEYRIPYLRIDIDEYAIQMMLEHLTSPENLEDFKSSLKNDWSSNGSSILATLENGSVGGYIHSEEEQKDFEDEDDLEADRIGRADLDEFDEDELGIIIYCYLALKDDKLDDVDSWLDGIREGMAENLPDYELVGRYNNKDFEEVIDWANEHYTFKPQLDASQYSATNIIYELGQEEPYVWDEEQQAFVWNVNKTNGQLQLQFESLTERLKRLTNEDFSPEAFKYMKGEYGLNKVISEPTQEEINKFVAKIDELPFIDEVKSIELMDGDVAMDFDIGVFCKFSEYIDWDNASINEINKYYQAIQLVIPDFEVSMRGNRVQIYIPMGYINYQTETINGLKEVERVVKEVHNELYK